MKKLIGLSAVLFITTSVFGQKFFRDFSFIETTPSGLNTIEDDIRDTVIFAGFYKYLVHFEANNRVFLLSYEPEQDNSRDIYLYSKDISDRNSSWEKAFEVNASTDPAVRASCVEFVLAGLYATDRISRSQHHGRIMYEFS